MSSMATVSLYGFSNFIYLFFGFNRNNLVLHHYVFVDQYVYDYRNCLSNQITHLMSDLNISRQIQ